MTEQNKNLTDGIAWPVWSDLRGRLIDSDDNMVAVLRAPTTILDAPTLAEILNEYDRLVRENRELKTWRPVTLPPTKTGFYLTFDEFNCVNVQEFANNAAGVLKWWGDDDEIKTPLYWMPLPKDPETDE